jgi:hypothetical protein
MIVKDLADEMVLETAVNGFADRAVRKFGVKVLRPADM